jgi:N-carbamoylputrescine amidase
MRIALVQMRMEADPQRNLEVCLGWLAAAAAQSADLVLFPEGQFGPYFPQFPHQDASRYLMALDHPILRAFQDACQEWGLAATANLYWERGQGRYSATALIDRRGEVLGISSKLHIACVPSFFEQHYFSPGQGGFPVYDLGLGRAGVVICYDRHYPESIRACALRGAELILVPTANVTAEDMTMFEWEMRVAAFQNNVFIAMGNRVGQEAEMTFAGASLVVDPDGQLLARAGGDEGLLVVDLDLAHVARSREARPYLALRRPELGSYL